MVHKHSAGVGVADNMKDNIMQQNIPPQFRNDAGCADIQIGVREFECIGARPPHDHPHIFLDMGDDETIICPYCSTRYQFVATLASDESNPPDAIMPSQ